MDILKYRLRSSPDPTKPPLNSFRSSRIKSKELNLRPQRCRTSSISGIMHDSRPGSISPPRRTCIPLSLVSTSNVNLPIHLQQKLLSNSQQRKALAGSLKLHSTYEYKEESVSEKLSIDTVNSKSHVAIESKECTF